MGTRYGHFVEQGGQDMMCAIKFEKCVVCDSIWTWCRLFVRLAEYTVDITWSDGCIVKLCELCTVWGCWKVGKPVELCVIDFPVLAVG